MSVISDFLKQILTAYYGKDVRQSIHDAIKQCYDDATGNPESVAAVVEQNDKMKKLLENTPYTTVESEGEFELPVHTINDNKISDDSTWSSKKIIDAIYPVGAIYMSVNSTNPSTLLGGTWVAWGKGRVPVCVDTENVNFNSVEKTGGESTVTLTESQIPSHRHGFTDGAKAIVYENPVLMAAGSDFQAFRAPTSGTLSVTETSATGGGDSHNNLQPYITYYMWKRTA